MPEATAFAPARRPVWPRFRAAAPRSGCDCASLPCSHAAAGPRSALLRAAFISERPGRSPNAETARPASRLDHRAVEGSLPLHLEALPATRLRRLPDSHPAAAGDLHDGTRGGRAVLRFGLVLVC